MIINFPLFRSAFLAFLGLVLSAAVVHASPSGDTLHPCLPLDFKQELNDQARPSGKRLADLSVGEPRTVRMIYFMPNDRPFRQEVVDSMRVRIRQAQGFYSEQMQAHGYGDGTFRFETDDHDEPQVHQVDGEHPDSHYLDETGIVFQEIDRIFDLRTNVYLVVVDNSIDQIGIGGRDAAGTGGSRGKNGGSALVPGGASFTTVAHELGHAFGLSHDFRDDAYIMSYGPAPDRLSACHAEFLAVHPYFNKDIPLGETQLSTVQLIFPRTFPPGSTSVSIQLEGADSDGLHQVILLQDTGDLTGNAVNQCRGLTGEKAAVVEFEYDGRNRSSFSIGVAVVYTKGDVTETSFVLSEPSPNQIAALEGHTASVRSVAFSPDGATLASGSQDNKVILWDVETGEQIATLKGTDEVNWVAFFPDGTTLASRSRDRKVILWDLASQEQIAALEGLKVGEYPMSLSPDGTIIATGEWRTVKLWDVETLEQIAALEGHTDGVQSLAFSHDGSTLGSGSHDGTVILWDIGSGQQVAGLKGDSWGPSLSFSPDGAVLASGGGGIASYGHTMGH